MAEGCRVVLGMDPHKRTVTVEAMAPDETVLDSRRFTTDVDGFAAMLAHGRRWSDRVWAVEGCEGIGKHVVLRLLDAGEQVIDVPAKLSARMRVYATGQGRKTDDTDAHSIALVGVRMAGLRQVVNDESLEVLRLLVDRRRRIGEDHTRMVCQLHVLLLELIPGGAKKDLSAAQARRLLAAVRPKDLAGKTRKRVAMGARGRPRAGLRAEEAGQQGARRPGQGHRDRVDELARHRPVRGCQAAGRGR